VTAQDEMLGNPQDTVGHAVHVRRERFGDDRDPHTDRVKRARDLPARNAMTRRRTVSDICDEAACRLGPPGWARPDTLPIMQTLVVDHPLIAHKLTALRDEHTEAPTFRRLTDELVTLLAYEATRAVRVLPVSVRTPVDEARGVKLARPVPLVVPILRAGIGMLDGMARLLPTADVGFVGLARDEESLVATTYANRLPADLTGRDVFVLDPMLATGGTLETVVAMLAERGAAGVTAVCLLAAPEGVARLQAAYPGDDPVPVRVVTAAMDDRLNERGYIVPGLGDAGDRLFGEI
jgi:uracil phosphoribosyltransferase